MKKIAFVVLACLSLGTVILSPVRAADKVEWKKVNGVEIPIPPTVHPRLYLRSSDIPELRERLKNPEIKKTIAKIQKLGVDRTPEEEAKAPDKSGFRYYAEMRGVTSRVQLEALDYLLNKKKSVARKAIVAMLDTLRNTNYGKKGDLSRASGQMLMCGAMVYDWCYDQMKDSEKKAYINEFVRISKTMECGYPPKNTEPIAGHSSEWMVMRDMLSAAIAIYDEFPEMYNHVMTMLCRDYIPVRNYVYAGHNYHQGTSYANVRFSNDLFSLWILDRMGAGAVYDPAQQFVMYDFLYRRRPDGMVLPAGDVNPGIGGSYGLPAMLAYSYYKDPYLAYEYKRNTKIDNHCLIFDVLWRDYTIEPKSPETLPLTKYSGTPYGWMIARTGWDKNSVIAEMKINEHFVGNHQHMDGGAFQIYYKGPLAIDAGAYHGTSGGYNSAHNKNFFKRTVAHNSLLVFDPNEKFASWNYGGTDKTEFADNDGGQRMPGDRWETCRSFADLLSDEYTTGQVLAHGIGGDYMAPEYSYLSGDITKAYSDKVKEVKRSFVFLNLKSEKVPAAMVVFDKVLSKNAEFKKHWLLHSIEQPQVSENGIIIKRTKDGDSGMLSNTVLLPAKENLDMQVIGGKGKEFWVNGTNYANAPQAGRPDPRNERGEWRVEVSPSAPANEDYFLNVIQVADNNCNELHKASLLRGENLVGAVIADRIVTFSKDGEQINGKAEMDVQGNGTFKFVMTNMKPGTWQVKKDGKIFIAYKWVGAEDGVLSFEGGSGHYEFFR